MSNSTELDTFNSLNEVNQQHDNGGIIYQDEEMNDGGGGGGLESRGGESRGSISFSAKDTTSPISQQVQAEPLSYLPTLQAQQASNSTNINSSNGTARNSIYDNNDSLHSAIQNSNISSSLPYLDYSTKTSMDELSQFKPPPSTLSLVMRIALSWGFGVVCQLILMLFNPRMPMHFIWGVLCIGCGMTAAFAISWASLLLKFPTTFLVIFSTTLYWVGTPITWQILYVQERYPPPIGVFTCIFPFEAVSLIFLCFLIPRAIRMREGHRKRVIAAFSSLIAPYLSFVSGLIYFRLFQYSNNIGRILLPPTYTIITKFIQLGLDIICVRCAHNASNLFKIIGRIIASYYSFAVLSFIRNPVSVVSIVLSKFALHVFMSGLMVFPKVEDFFTSFIPQGLIGWKNKFELGVKEDDSAKGEEGKLGDRNEFDKMYLEKDANYARLHSDATNLWFSMFSDVLAIIMSFSVYLMGRYGPTNAHYNSMFPFASISSPKGISHADSFEVFLFYLAVCFAALMLAYVAIWVALKRIIKILDFTRIKNLVSVNWFPLNHFSVMCCNMMMAYVIVVVALMPDLFYIPTIDFWSTNVA